MQTTLIPPTNAHDILRREQRVACQQRRCAKDEFNPRGQLFFTPLVQAMRMIIHLGETVPDTVANVVFRISAPTLLLWTFVVFFLMLLTFGIGAASGAHHSGPFPSVFRKHFLPHLLHVGSHAEDAPSARKADRLISWRTRMPACHSLSGQVCRAKVCGRMKQRIFLSEHRMHGQDSAMLTLAHACAGIFIPSLAVGGAWGRLVGMLVLACLRHAGSSLPVSLPAYTVLLPRSFPREELP